MSQAWAGIEYKGYAFTEQELESVIDTIGDNVLNIKKQYWQDKLLNVRDYISKALDAVFRDSNAWQSIMRQRALPQYKNFVNPAYARSSLILLKYQTKLLSAYEKWKQRKDAAFAENGSFEKGVTTGADFYAEGVKIVYRLTGVRPLGLGPAPKAFMVITGMPIPIIEGKDTLTGEPRNIFFSETLYFIGYAVIPAVVEAATYAHYAQMAGDANLRDQILSDISGQVKELLTRLAADDVQVDDFTIGYDENVNNYFIHVKASPKQQGG